MQTTPRTASAPNEGSPSCEQRRRRLSPPKKIGKITQALFRNYSTHGGPRRAGGQLDKRPGRSSPDTPGTCSTHLAHVQRKLPLFSHCPEEFRINYHIGVLAYIEVIFRRIQVIMLLVVAMLWCHILNM